MSFDITDFVSGVCASRKYFLKHIKSVREDQLDWKPYPECNSIRETVAHLISDDRAALEILQTGKFPDYDGAQEDERDMNKLLSILAESHETLCAFVIEKFADTPLDTEVNFFKGREKLGLMLAEMSSEDYYHAGQVAFIRMATDPSWNYYADIYGGG
ncbi:MAG: DinB family protein [Armatimonadota bacterium]